MSTELRDRMQRGEALTALGLDAQAPVAAVVRSIRRKRAVRATATATLGLLTVSGAALGASAVIGGHDTLPAGPLSGAPVSATASPSANAPSEAASPAPTLGPEVYPSEPEMVNGVPVLVAASQEVADNTLKPRPGPDFVPGERRPLDQVLSQASIASCSDERCGMAALPSVTTDVLRSGRLTAVIDEEGSPAGAVDFGDQLQYLVVAGPDIGAYMAVDLSAWGQDEGLYENWFVTDLAVDDDGHRIAVVLQENVTQGPGADPSMLVVFDLNTGTSTVVAEDMDFASVEWDGSRWRVFGYGTQGTLGALVASDGQSWTADGVQVARGWWMQEDRGFSVIYGQGWPTRWWVLDGRAYPYQPEGATWCFLYAASASEGYIRASCEFTKTEGLGDRSPMDNYQITAGEGWAPLDPALESQAPPASTSFGALDDGYVLWRESTGTTFLKNGRETSIDAPEVEPIRSYLADGGLWTLGDSEIGWLSPDLEYRTIVDYSGLVVATVYPYGERPSS